MTHVACPTCGHSFQLHHDALDANAKCPNCKLSFHVKDNAVTKPTPEPLTVPTVTDAPRPSASRYAAPQIARIVVALCVIIFTGYLGIRFLSAINPFKRDPNYSPRPFTEYESDHEKDRHARKMVAEKFSRETRTYLNQQYIDNIRYSWGLDYKLEAIESALVVFENDPTESNWNNVKTELNQYSDAHKRALFDP